MVASLLAAAALAFFDLSDLSGAVVPSEDTEPEVVVLGVLEASVVDDAPVVPLTEPLAPIDEPDVVASLALVPDCGKALVPPPLVTAPLADVPLLYEDAGVADDVVAAFGDCLLSRLSPRAKAEPLTAKMEAAMNTGASLRMETSCSLV